ncbi:conserved hypothetical protein [Ricinus communis]|uniref:Uncharacterized protein n=1 Tax=Ricinus communis TaxID=3988 RepID=B9RLD8_RICCO|nr:conserved hypothetical protein [Ricinus communis]
MTLTFSARLIQGRPSTAAVSRNQDLLLFDFRKKGFEFPSSASYTRIGQLEKCGVNSARPKFDLRHDDNPPPLSGLGTGCVDCLNTTQAELTTFSHGDIKYFDKLQSH